MAVIRNSANTIMRGRVGETTYYVNGGQQIARQAKNNSNYGDTARRSEAQQLRRIMWANLVNFYKASATWMPKAFETKKRNQTDYNKFMQLNIGSARIALTKDEAAAGACVVDGFIVSQGSLPTIEVSRVLTGWVTNISIGALTIDATTTVGAFSTAVIDNNVTMRAGMQLSFVNYTQTADSLGTPRLVSRLYEVTLKEDSEELLRDYLPSFASTTIEGYLGSTPQVTDGAFTYIVSEIAAGSLRVSTQQLTVKNQFNLLKYTTLEQREKAVASYGVDQEVILNPNLSVEQEAPVFNVDILSITYEKSGNSVTVVPGDQGPIGGDFNGVPLTITLDGWLDQTITSAAVTMSNGRSDTTTTATITAGVATVTFSEIQYTTIRVASVSLTLSDGQIVVCQFNNI